MRTSYVKLVVCPSASVLVRRFPKLRILAGVTPVKDEKIPLRTFDRTNIGTVDLNASDATWYGPTDYKAEYKKLWGIG